jgi:hypothetical protein
MEARACELLEVADHDHDASAQAIVVLAAHELTRVEACPVVKGSRPLNRARLCLHLYVDLLAALELEAQVERDTLVVDVLLGEVRIEHLDRADRLGGRQYGAHEREEETPILGCPEQHFENQIQLRIECVPPHAVVTPSNPRGRQRRLCQTMSPRSMPLLRRAE